jgi:hypothetical protein
LKIAIKRLEQSDECRQYLAGFISGDPLGVLRNFKQNNQFSYGGPNADYVAYTTSLGKNGHVVLYDSFFDRGVGGYRREYNFANSTTARAFIILHELGHVTGSYFHIPLIKAGSAAQVNPKIYEKCFADPLPKGIAE